ncbi:hypothetical protein GIB67_012084 [Kingdonia uniflora]|uniref:F-box protein n=1 Tax=Kingdonia uniflora TaxID=39325 RepID=A0A7J7LHX0_9MAGN|nr:hypothetical protein GIB67_012084 [Kingdonia uniflora]
MERGFLLRNFSSVAKKKRPNVSTIGDSQVEILCDNGSNGETTVMGLSKNPQMSMGMVENFKTKKLCNGSTSGSSSSSGNGENWESTSPEILALIFIRIVADELMRVVPFVCSSWLDVVDGPYCWLEIDIEEWSRRCDTTSRIDSAVRKLMRRSKGTCRRINVYKLGNDGYSSVAYK